MNNEFINKNLLGPWSKQDHISKYTTSLALLDHLRELLILDDEIKRLKSHSDGGHDELNLKLIKDQFDRECADLWWILSSYLEFDNDGELPEILNERAKKFREKQKND